jgi:(1->4)-alpha-D-glucan 1-alpha-D-glucosylmutase
MHVYAEKAMREASEDTNWIDPKPDFELAVHAAVDAAYDDPRLHEPLRLFRAEIGSAARSNSLAQKLVQLTMPGVPDVYQGCELWDDNLVDPDNRRPVDFARRADLLRWLDRTREPPPIDDSGAAKLWLVSRTLRLRRDCDDLFADYRPVPVGGEAADHVLAYDRGGAITVATRLPVGLAAQGGFGNTTVRLDGAYTDVLTAERHVGAVRLAVLLRRYPVALLVRG